MLRYLSTKIPYKTTSNNFLNNIDSYRLFKKDMMDISKVVYYPSYKCQNNDDMKYYNQNFDIKNNDNWNYEW